MSGLSNPLETMPQDIHVTLWSLISQKIQQGCIAVTREIYDELLHLPGEMGACIKSHETLLMMEIGSNHWDWQSYSQHIQRMQKDHRAFIGEYNGKGKSTIGLNDLSIIALGKSLGVPVLSMEKACANITQPSAFRRKIPDICLLEGVPHVNFNEFLRLESVSI